MIPPGGFPLYSLGCPYRPVLKVASFVLTIDRLGESAKGVNLTSRPKVARNVFFGLLVSYYQAVPLSIYRGCR